MLKYNSTDRIHNLMVYEFTKEWQYLLEKKTSYEYYYKINDSENATYQRQCMMLTFERLETYIDAWGCLSNQMTYFQHFLWLCVFTKIYPEANEKGKLKKVFDVSLESWRKKQNERY